MEKLFLALLVLFFCNCASTQVQTEDATSKCREVRTWYDDNGEFHREIIEVDCD